MDGYRSAEAVQNELLQAVGYLIRQRIVTAINNAKFLSVLADETQYQAKHKLLQVTVCYVERTADNKWVLKNKIHYV